MISKGKKIILVVGARPNYMKIAPVIKGLNKLGVKNHILVHTGQHYDKNMSEVFFEQLDLPKPEIFLGVGSNSHARQTADILIKFEEVLYKYQASIVIVAGDVNSTLACALVAVKLNIPVAHIESGLRSFDMSMPEEVNRILTDKISNILFVSEESGMRNLQREGVHQDKIFFVGNCMIDSLKQHIKIAISKRPWGHYNLSKGEYGILTLHRPSNVDDIELFKGQLKNISILSKQMKILFPAHPRTLKIIKKYHIKLPNTVIIIDPLPYLQFIGLMSASKLIITDSGGVQEESTFLGINCLTLRENTERPVTINFGTNHLIGSNPDNILPEAKKILSSLVKLKEPPKKWDGKAGERIASIIKSYIS